MSFSEDYLNEMDCEETKSNRYLTTQSPEQKKKQSELNDEVSLITKDLVNELLTKIEDQLDENENQQKRIKLIKSNKKNENEIIISSDESDSSSESSSEEEDSEADENRSLADDTLNSDTELNNEDLDRCLIRLRPLKTKGELLIEELPEPDENFQLILNIDDLQQIGNVCKILDNLVIVESFKNLPALDLDSILFFRTGLAVGRIFDVIGPVCKPFYIIRFSSNNIIQTKSIFINMPVYFAVDFVESDQNLTKYVLISQLKNTRGSDASWEHNNEPPEHVKDYSDDEEERKEKLLTKSNRKLERNDYSNHKRPRNSDSWNQYTNNGFRRPSNSIR